MSGVALKVRVAVRRKEGQVSCPEHPCDTSGRTFPLSQGDVRPTEPVETSFSKTAARTAEKCFQFPHQS